MLEEVRPSLTPSKLLVSIAAGVSTRQLEEMSSGRTRVVRLMPNTPCVVGEGASVYSPGRWARPEEDGEVVRALMSAVGECHQVRDTEFTHGQIEKQSPVQ